VCPICNKVESYLRIYNDGSDGTKRQNLANLLKTKISDPQVVGARNPWSAAKAFLKSGGFCPSDRYYMNIMLTSNPEEVFLFEAPPTVANPIANLQMGDIKDYRDFMHPIKGRNIYIEKIGGGRTAKYFPKPRAEISKLPDMKVLQRMYNLSDIDQLIDDPNVKFLRPSRFEDDSTTEIRVLPNWDFVASRKDPTMRKDWDEFGYIAFLTTIWWHYGIGKDEFEMLGRGELPFPFEATGEHNPPTEEDVPMFDEHYKADYRTDKEIDILMELSADSEPPTADATTPNPTGDADDPCYGLFEDGSIICDACEKAVGCKETSK